MIDSLKKRKKEKMGQKTSTITDTASTINYEVQRHTKLLSELGTLKYEEFQKCLAELNALSRKCIDSNGKQLVFAVSKGTDDTLLWKATVKIACVKVDPETRHVDNYKLLNLKEFLQVWKTFHTHVQSMNASEKQQVLLIISFFSVDLNFYQVVIIKYFVV